MICATVTGYLASEPKVAFQNATGEVYRVRLGSNHNRYDSATKTWKKETVWCSALVSQKKMGMMQQFFKKGTPVVIASSDASLNYYTVASGETKCDLDLGYADRIEAYQRLPRVEQQPPQQAGAMAYGQQPLAQPEQQATHQYQGQYQDDQIPPVL